MKYNIINNFIEHELDFLQIKNFILTQYPFYYTPKDDGFVFTHLLFSDNNITSNYLNMLRPIYSKLDLKALIRVKVNIFPNLNNEFIEYKSDSDLNYSHKKAIIFLNTNNGYTQLENGEKIESLENSVLLLENHNEHIDTNCTNDKIRCTIVIEYF
jgi:hypothetical protein